MKKRVVIKKPLTCLTFICAPQRLALSFFCSDSGREEDAFKLNGAAKSISDPFGLLLKVRDMQNAPQYGYKTAPSVRHSGVVRKKFPKTLSSRTTTFSSA